jgi:hypothetical protein
MPDVKSTTTELQTVVHAQIEKDTHTNAIRNALLCAFAVAVCVLVIYPVADIPNGDDFSYSRTTLDFARTGHFLYNGWGASIIGWLVLWGTLFIRFFGFSFTGLRLSMLPIAMATVYLLHQVLRRFGINQANAVLGTLTIALSPLFLLMTTSFMTDVPGLLVIVVCIYMCQGAVTAQSDRASLWWLCSAAFVNVGAGTVRQIAWLGALVMVPSTAWLLRKRSGMKTAGLLVWLAGLAGIVACLHWANKQPYFTPETFPIGLIRRPNVRHLVEQLMRALLCLLLVISPITAAWLPAVRRLNSNAKLRIGMVMLLLVLLSILLYRKGTLDQWVEPWLIPVLDSLQSSAIASVSLWVKVTISFLLVIAPALILVEQIRSRPPQIEFDRSGKNPFSWKELGWILGPFTLSYVVFLVPRGTFGPIQDRYLLGLVPAVVIVLLKFRQEHSTERLSVPSLVTLAIVSIFAIGSIHDVFAGCRALVTMVRMVQDSGVPRTSIEAGLAIGGWAQDGWTQLEADGYIHDPRIQIPIGVKPNPHDLNLPKECMWYFTNFTPAITPRYFIVMEPKSCFVPTEFATTAYTTWFPPFRRALYIQQLSDGSK